jgi:site-specific DNA recombinase
MPKPRTTDRRRTFGYARVSGAEQERTGTSLDAQQRAIVAACETRGWPAPTLFVEVDSGANESRVKLGELTALLREGDIVLVTRVDRWSRDTPHAVKSVRDLVKRGVEWHAIGDNIDAATPHGDSMLGIMAWAADNERRRILDRMVGTRRRLRDEGYYIDGLPPLGYRRDGRTLVVKEDEAELLREIHKQCHGGKSIGDILRWLRVAHPWRKWDKKVVHQLLISRTSLGEVRDTSGEWIDAKHEPVIDELTWKRSQDALARRRLGGRSGASPLLLRGGLAACALCGARMSTTFRILNPRTSLRRHYYACGARIGVPMNEKRCVARYVVGTAVDEAVGALVVVRLAELGDELARGNLMKPADVERAEKAVKKLAAKRERLIDLYAEGTLTKTAMRRRVRDLDGERAEAEAQLGQARALSGLGGAVPQRAALRTVEGLRAAWGLATTKEARRVVELLIATPVRIARDEEPRVTWKPIAALLTEL